mgnify:CR=1 FL=1
MAKIKEVRVDAIHWRLGAGRCGYYWDWLNFKTFTDDNGNSTYYINGEEVSKEEGNQRYLEIKRSNEEFKKTDSYKKYAQRKESVFKQTVTEREVSYEELIKEYEASIDQYTEYIENYRQQQQAEAHNEAIYKKIEWLKQLIKERKA